ncbi:glycosyltransferase family 4 protein [Patescibacteria group bacterium]|nr:glycosyltransferase family 4 protein [Patescibacteria group bacterium]
MIVGIDAHNLEGNRTGVGRYLANLLREWSKLNFQFPRQRRGSPGAAISNFQFILYFKNEIPDDLPKSNLFEKKLLQVGSTAKFVHWDLPRAAKKDKVDILFCPGYVAPLCYKGRIALVLHDIIYEAHPEWFNWSSRVDKILLKWVSKKAAQKSTMIFVPSEFTRQEVIKYYRVNPQKVKLTYLAADLGIILPPPSPRLRRASQSFPYKGEAEKLKKFGIMDKFGLYIGSIFSRRYLPEVIGAFGRLAAEKPDYQLILGGKDYTRARNTDDLIVRENESLGRRAILRVDFIGDSDLKLLYSACAFFIYLSDYEGFGLPPLEAMSCGAPVIISDGTSLKEVAEDAAFLIKNNSDVEEIYRAMKKIVDDANLRSELIVRGRGQAAKFSWEKCAQETLSALLNA